MEVVCSPHSKTHHYTLTALHTVNNTVGKWVQPNAAPPPCVNNHCSTRYDQSFRNNKYTHTYQKAAAAQGTGHIKFMANYIKGRNAYTTYRNHTSSQRQFKTGVP